jgi:hypothetical protein
MPVPASHELNSWAYFLVSSTKHPSVGWEDRPTAKGGPCYLVGRDTAALGTKVFARFPLTQQGWTDTWRYLQTRDNALDGQIRAKLAERVIADEARLAYAAFKERMIAQVKYLTLLGGYAEDVDLPTGKFCELLFLPERLIVVRTQGSLPLMDFQYGDVEEVEIGGPGLVHEYTWGQRAGMTVAFGPVGAVYANSAATIRTVIRVRAPSCELFFLCESATPDKLRMELSRPLATIREARAARTVHASAQPPASDASAKVGELTRLASLLDAGLLTREEFDQLKAQLLTEN